MNGEENYQEEPEDNREDQIDRCLVCDIEIPPGPDFCGPSCEQRFEDRDTYAEDPLGGAI